MIRIHMQPAAQSTYNDARNAFNNLNLYRNNAQKNTVLLAQGGQAQTDLLALSHNRLEKLGEQTEKLSEQMGRLETQLGQVNERLNRVLDHRL